MAVVTLLAPIPHVLGTSIEVSFVLAAVAGVGLAAIGLSASERLWAAVLGMLVMILPPFVGLALTETSLLGPIVDVPIAGAPQARWASGFRFSDGTLRVDLARPESIAKRGRGSTSFHKPTMIAPVVSSDWTEAQPVHVWAVADGSTAMPEDWRQPLRAGLRLLADEDRDRALRRVERRLGVTSSSDRVLIAWVADPADARLSAWLTLLEVIAAGAVCWTLLVLGFGSSPAGAGKAK